MNGKEVEIWRLLVNSSQSVVVILCVAIVGAILVRKKFVSENLLDNLGKVIFYAMLPCLLFTSVSKSLDLESLQKLWYLPVVCVIYMICGFGVGIIINKLCKVPQEYHRAIIIASGFGNSGYLPIPLMTAVLAIFPFFQNLNISEDVGKSYVSMYLIAFSPLMWSVGYTIMAQKENVIRGFHIEWKKIITPPIWGIILGVIVGMIPAAKSNFCYADGHFYFLYKAAETIADGAVPSILIMLGGKLAYGPQPSGLGNKSIIGFIVLKMIVFPIVALCAIFALRYYKIFGDDPVLYLLLIIEAAVPPANNLIVICSLVNRRIETGLAALIFYSYLASIPLLTFFIMLAMWTLNRYFS
ncbi:AEC family transporter [Lentisphaerota bacterium WC36G]|nr:AEC family transporter [Lentisphaerae bacterium WC36]